MTDTAFAERLRALMGAKGLTMAGVGSGCSVSPQAVHKWCHGVAMPSSKSLMAICKMGQCSIEWLLDPAPLDWESTANAPQGRHAKYWVREAVAELREIGLLP